PDGLHSSPPPFFVWTPTPDVVTSQSCSYLVQLCHLARYLPNTRKKVGFLHPLDPSKFGVVCEFFQPTRSQTNSAAEQSASTYGSPALWNGSPGRKRRARPSATVGSYPSQVTERNAAKAEVTVAGRRNIPRHAHTAADPARPCGVAENYSPAQI